MNVLIFLRSAMFVGLVAGTSGCRTICPVVVGEADSTTISDDICAAEAYFVVRVTDPLGAPIEGVEVWEILSDPYPEIPGPTHARLRWLTDASGRLDAQPCLMGGSDFEQWRIAPAPVKVSLLVVREQYGPQRIVVNIPASEILATGSPNGPKGVSFSVSDKGAAIVQGPGYRWNTTVTLVPVAK
jgi:hypothetical protein